jgi:hypothetical protein
MVAAQAAELPIDLGTLKPGTYTFPIPSEATMSVKIKNRLPDKSTSYSVTINVTPFEIRVLNVKAFEATTAGITPAGTDPCSTIKKLDADIVAATEESSLPNLRKQLEEALKDPSCVDAGLRKHATDLLASLDWVSDPIAVTDGDSVHVVITRKREKVADVTWDVTFATRPPGEFQAVYGFAFLPSNDRTYTARPATNGTYTIVRDHDRTTADFAPVVFFQWIPAKSPGQNIWPPNFTAGIGFDRDNISVYGGLTAVFHRNIGIAAGIAMQKEKRLAGQYKDGDIIKDNLTADQLSKTTYAPNLFIALTFRFGSQPFSVDKSDKGTGNKGK